ncbi:IclR family transcriptional regulator [Kribbella sp. NBC_00662]|jgi:IclR family acetate operon transcriptional repressor|uniref:IclR family transcriptional regulator n=1 Tax=Kribbella sp. NBC_00662 TaxID=2975969 RepID=UPI00324ADAAA
MAETNDGGKARTGSVQSIERAFGLLETMADAGGMMGLSQLATASGLPLPTIHRLVRTLVDLGYLRQEPSRQYILGPKLIRLGESSSHMLSVFARPHLAHLVDELGESANMAMLDGDQIVYLAQVPSRHSMRMFTEVGRRVLPHCTAVGKAILAQFPESQVRDLLHRTGMPKHTDNTITTPDAFTTQLHQASDHGYAMDEGEQEVGVRCVAVAVPDAPSPLAISISGPAGRMTEDLVERAVPLLTQAAKSLSEDLH